MVSFICVPNIASTTTNKVFSSEQQTNGNQKCNSRQKKYRSLDSK